ncbi:MAG TPA: NAD(P)H-hydrate dehydratase [Terriglobales bacterium]|nr:NAD(P)H-hydrate dehydratase [Terriglobales bacterium]
MKIVTAGEMREIDRVSTERFGVPSLTLMENAGRAVADFVTKKFPAAYRVGVICGKGNNGGDGFVVARLLHSQGRDVQVLLLADPSELKGDAAANLAKLPVTAALAHSLEELASHPVFECDVLIDAILGTGFRPPVNALYAEAIARINQSKAKVIAVDIPSGADADAQGQQTGTIARSDAVVTFTAPRPAHVFGTLTRGPLIIAPIGSPDEAIQSSLNLNLTTPADIAPLFGPRPRDSNKGMYGHVLVLGGSVGKAGAAAMAGIAALRAGAGLSTVGTPKSVLPTVAGYHPELMTEALEETEIGSISLRALGYGHVDALAKGMTVLAVGPGISRHNETSEFVRTVVRKFTMPMVLDADGLNAFEGRAAELSGKGRVLVITPHPGEMARLLGGVTVPEVQRDRVNIARTFALEHDIIVVLKGDRTVIAHPDGTVWINPTGNPGMATGGTGDILTGMTAGMLAQNPKQPLEAVIAAVYLHGLAGNIACESMGEHSLIATDLLGALPEAFRRSSIQRLAVSI